MGSTISKSPECKVDIARGVSYSDPVLTPNIRRLELDPRSPSAEIARTPIEVLKTPCNNSDTTLTEYVKTEEANVLDALDPRSPTADFERTPITETIPKLRNKLLDNARGPSVEVTPVKPKKVVQLGKKICIDSTATPDSVEKQHKRRSAVGLLETNIDFVETDLDEVIQAKIREQMELSLVVADDSNQTDSESSVKEEPQSDSISTCSEDILAGDSCEKLVEDVEHLSVAPVDTKACVIELDRKLTNLIYEDKNLEESPKLSGKRTPLRYRNGNKQLSKSAAKLKVSDRPTKGSSKIPVFKDKKVVSKSNVQCENTPPRTKAKKSQWSTEDSMLI